MPADTQRPRLTLCLEQTLGHRAHGLNLEAAAAAHDTPVGVLHVDFPESPRLRMPWALRGSASALRQARRAPPADVTLFHTQTISLLAPLAVARGRGRYVVSVDATPLQMDELAEWYQHGRHWAPVEEAKRRWYRWVLKHSAGVVTWSRWAADSAVRDYGVSPDRLLVAHPGAPDPFFDVPRGKNGHRPRILFVGGDFERKGGPALLQAFVPLASKAELVLVTGAAVPEQAGVTVLRDIRPGTAEQLRVFADADVFCLPTLGDCTSVALGEAMAAGLPVVTTTIASNPEWVPEDVGALISPNDDVALRAALERLVENASLRQSMGARARDWAEQHMRARRNAGRILRFMEEVA